jgi:hypothetical protein
MSERYWVTGVQLGLLQVGDEKERKKLVSKIVNEQFVTNVKCNVVDKIIKELKEKGCLKNE